MNRAMIRVLALVVLFLVALAGGLPAQSEDPTPLLSTPLQGEDLEEAPAPSGSVSELEQLAEASFVQDDLRSAVALYRQLLAKLESGREKARIQVTVAWLHHLQGQNNQALASLTDAFIQVPDFPFHADLYSEDFRYLFYEAQKQAVGERAARAARLVKSGFELLRQRDYQAARVELKKALALDSGQPRALYNLALVELYDGQYEEALAGFQKVLALEASRPGTISRSMSALAFTNLGFIYNQRHRYDEAANVLEQAVELDPDNASAWSNLGVTRRRLGQTLPAADAFRRAYALDPSDAGVMNNLALAFIDAENWVEAVALLRDAVARNGGNASLWLNLGLAQLGMQNEEGALTSWQTTIAQDPDDRGGWASAAAIHLARYHHERGNARESLAAADQALAWRSDLVNAWSYKGLAEKALGKLAEARKSLEEARRLDPTRAETYNNLGTVYYALGLRREATSAFERALDIQPGFTDARANLEAVRQPGGRLPPPPSQASVNRPPPAQVAPPPPTSAPPPPPPPPPSATTPPRLGIRFADIDYSALGLRGVMVDSVEAGGAADRAGLQKGDLILKIDGADIIGPNTLREEVRNRKPGSTVLLDLLRNNLPQRVEVKLD